MTICYDHDEAGRNANQVAYTNARNYFSSDTKVNIIQFPDSFRKGYDIGNYLDEGNNIQTIISY